MLNSLHIENIAVIERADIAFDRGFNVLSGETGAGKSIVIDSLNAVLGERIGRDIVRTGTTAAQVVAVFSELSESTLAKLQSYGCEPDEDGALILERRLTADGKAAARINGRPVTVAILREIGRSLVNIHGQHDNQALLNADSHMEYLDRLGGHRDALTEYRYHYNEYRQIESRLRSLDVDERQKAQRMDLLRYQIDEIESAALQAGEEHELLARREMFRNSEKIARSLDAAYQYLNGDDDTDGALVLLQQAANSVATVGKFTDDMAALGEKIQALQYELDACADELRAFGEAMDFNQAERDEVENRCELLRRLFSKYGSDTVEVLAYLDSCRAEYEAMESGDAEKAGLTAALDVALKATTEAAARLTAARCAAAKRFCKDVTEQLSYLDMPRVTLTVSMESVELGPNGADKVEFLLSANPGEQPRPLQKIASGGEMSRVMLAFQTVLADVDDMETLVFDEIDTGVSGRAALKVGQKMHEIAVGQCNTPRRQVLCVTHLAQIAAQADHHLLIEKAVRDDRTYTDVTPLDENGRERELARIIGGEVTVTNIEAARELRREHGVLRAWL